MRSRFRALTVITRLTLATVVMSAPAAAADPAPQAAYPATDFPDPSGWGRHIQRTMRLLATSTPEHRNTVRILFYGQSITAQAWTTCVEQDLRRRFPDAELIVENRALGGFASQMLVKTAETDLYPFNPDLLIFHVYGANAQYEDIIRRTRERTTAEILMQTDHVTKPEDFTEETDPAKLGPEKAMWDAFMNHDWLPMLATRYGAELCDQRTLWKAYLTENHLAPKDLLSDSVHLNAHGEWLMAQCVQAYLRYDPALGPSPAEEWVKTIRVDEDIAWSQGKLRLEFSGSSVELVPAARVGDAAEVWIDGKRPSEIPELKGFSRAVATPGGKWPVIAPVGSAKPLLLEEWTLAVSKSAETGAPYRFTLSGSRTGPDGEGRSDAVFASNSGRVVISPDAWNVPYAMSLAKVDPLPATFTVTWSVVPHSMDSIAAGAQGRVLVAHGLANTKHVLEIRGGATTPVREIRIHRPPLGRIQP
jgi:hypothetical protein